MSRRASLSRPALTDLVEIWVYVAQDDPRAADRPIEALRARCQMLVPATPAGAVASRARSGHPKLGLREAPDFLPRDQEGIEVGRVRSGEQDLESLFER